MTGSGDEDALKDVTVQHLLLGEIRPGEEIIVDTDAQGREVMGTFVRVSRLPRNDSEVYDEGRVLVRMYGERTPRETKPSVIGLRINGGDPLS